MNAPERLAPLAIEPAAAVAAQQQGITSRGASLPQPQPPVFATVAEERLHRKQRLAAGFRLFSKFGFDEGVAGHITARDPEHTDTFWVNPFGVHFSQVSVSNLIRCDHEGHVVEGAHPVNTAAFVIHSRVHGARPDVIGAAHSHSTHGRAFSTLGMPLAPLTQDACAFYDDHALYDDFGGVVVDLDEGARIAQALGGHKAAILANHGLLTVGRTVDEGGLVVHHDGALVPGAVAGRVRGRPDRHRAQADRRSVGAPVVRHRRQPLRRLVPVPAAVCAHRQGTARPAGLRRHPSARRRPTAPRPNESIVFPTARSCRSIS